MKKPILPDPFTPISARDVTEHADIEATARSLAVQRLPPAVQTALSKAEAAVVELIEVRSAARATQRADRAAGIRERLVELPDPRADRNLLQLPEHVTNCIMGVFHEHTPVIRQTVSAERNGMAEFGAWRDKHNLLERQPVYPPSRLLHFATILLVMMVEAAGNAYLYLDATPAGVFGALATAFLVAALNVTLAVIAGLVPTRYLNLPDKRVRYWAIPLLGVLAATIVFLNFYAAHLRDLASAIDDLDQTPVLAHMLHHPFDLSLLSYGLFIFGLIFASIAALKGYTASDPYPGYEQQHRRYVDALDDLNYLKSAIHGGLDSVRQAEIVYAADKPLAAHALIEAIRKSHGGLAVQQDRDRALDASDIKAATSAIQRFRDLNLAIRTDGIVPAYFARTPDFAHLLHRSDTASTIAPQVEAATEKHREHTEQFSKLITRLLQQMEAAKDNTELMMRAIEKSVVDETALPSLAELRTLLEPHLPPPQPGEKTTCTSTHDRPVNSAKRPTAAVA